MSARARSSFRRIPGRGRRAKRRGRSRVGSCLLAVATLICLSHLAHAEAAIAPPGSSDGRDVSLMASVFGTALGFLAPRILEPTPIPTLAAWGLNGISAVDPSLVASFEGGDLQLRSSQGIVWRASAPASADANAWGRAAASMCGAALQASLPVRNAGVPGLIQAFFDELFNHLDPYSRYVAPAPAESERDRREGQGGIGAKLVAGRHGLSFAEISPEGPAAGVISPGDRLVAIDGAPVAAIGVARAAALLAGEVGTELRLRVRPAAGGREADLTLTRALVAPETVFAQTDGGLLDVRITGFSRNTAGEISAVLDEAMQAGPLRGLILDLRGNRGGLLQQAVTTAALVLERGIVVTTEGRYPQSNHVWSVQGGDITRGVPIVVLVDGRTASAAEIVAAALADHGRAVVTGSSTFGKGLVQTILQLPDGGELFVTWSRVLAPLGWPLQGLGVLPQLCTSRGAGAVGAAMRDLGAGRSPLSAALAAERRARPPVPVTRILGIRAACPAAIGTDEDQDAARALLADPAAYRTALASVASLAGPGGATR